MAQVMYSRKPVKVVCSVCQEPFFRNRAAKQREVCSKECRGISNTEARNCKECKRLYRVAVRGPKKSGLTRRIYCSEECRYKNRRKRIVCRFCGQVSLQRTGLYCSLQCYNQDRSLEASKKLDQKARRRRIRINIQSTTIVKWYLLCHYRAQRQYNVSQGPKTWEAKCIAACSANRNRQDEGQSEEVPQVVKIRPMSKGADTWMQAGRIAAGVLSRKIFRDPWFLKCQNTASNSRKRLCRKNNARVKRLRRRTLEH